MSRSDQHLEKMLPPPIDVNHLEWRETTIMGPITEKSMLTLVYEDEGVKKKRQRKNRHQ
jgi:hypothetical protein